MNVLGGAIVDPCMVRRLILKLGTPILCLLVIGCHRTDTIKTIWMPSDIHEISGSYLKRGIWCFRTDSRTAIMELISIYKGISENKSDYKIPDEDRDVMHSRTTVGVCLNGARHYEIAAGFVVTGIGENREFLVREPGAINGPWLNCPKNISYIEFKSLNDQIIAWTKKYNIIPFDPADGSQ
jgi:hypothetical protein